MDDAPAIRLDGVRKRFGQTDAVRDLSFTVPRGALCGLLGPNGAGKSTTIRMVMSIIEPDAGRIEVLGGRARAERDRIGYLPEGRGLYPRMRVGEYLAYIARLKGVPAAEIPPRVAEGLRQVDLPDVARRRCHELSRGMQQKVQLLAALVHRPPLLILDEPFTGLDPVNVERVESLMRALCAQGTTIVLSTHALHRAEHLCDRVLLLNRGDKLLDASLDAVRAQFDPRVVEVELAAPGEVEPPPGVEAMSRDGALRLTLRFAEGTDPAGVMQAVTARWPVHSVARRRPTLEEVFIDLVGRAAPRGGP